MPNPIEVFVKLSFMGKVLSLLSFTVLSYLGFIRSGFSLAPWVPTHKRDLERVNQLCSLKPNNTYIEAGCGNALVTKYIAKQNPETHCVGIEYSVFMYAWAKISTFFSVIPNIEIKYGDALKYDLGQADVVYAYGLTKTVNQKLLPKIKQELKPGAKFISYAFAIKEPDVVVDYISTSSNIYIYTQK